jgi:alkylation response protein AidB-like acyl-CoA dehydrogenase
MLSFELDQEQKMLLDAIGRFAEGPMRKVYRDAEEEREIPANVLQAGWEFGLIPSALPQDYGGLGEYSVVTGALAMEAFAYGDLAITLNMAAPGLVAYPLLLAGTEAQQAVYLPRFAEDRPPHMTAALIEPHVQFDPYRLKSTAVREGDGYVLNGVKSVVPLAEGAELVLVYADEDGRTQAFLVPGDSPGLAVGPRERLMGVSALPTYALRLEGCRVPAENRLGGDQGVDFGLILNHSRVALGAMAVGLAKAAYDYARDYAKNRVQFGEPVAHRQSIAFMLAEMAIDVDAARLLVWEAAWHLDRGHDATRDAAVMKHFVDDMVVRTADRALQTLGGYGYIREFPAELWLRNARGFASFDGLAIV